MRQDMTNAVRKHETVARVVGFNGAKVGVALEDPFSSEGGQIRAALKSVGCRWNKEEKLWVGYGKQVESALSDWAGGVEWACSDFLRSVDPGGRQAVVIPVSDGFGVDLVSPFSPDGEWARSVLKDLSFRWGKSSKLWVGDAAQIRMFVDRLGQDEVLLVGDAESAVSNAEERASLSDAVSVDSDIEARIKEVLPEGLNLFPFQMAGVRFLETCKGRALVGDEMGLGKTIQALAYLAVHREQWPVVVVAPAVVSTNWQNEIQKWIPDASVFRFKGKKAPKEAHDFYIVSYDLFWRRYEILQGLGIRSMVLDESHYIKNIKAQRTKAVVEFAKEIQDRGGALIALSGTPILNRPVEFFTTLKTLRPKQFGSWWKYAKRYCGMYEGKWGLEFEGPTNTDELGEKLRDLMVRRLKANVLTELPEKVRQTIPVELSAKARKEYNQAISDADIVIAQITAARKAIGATKAAAAVELAEQILSGGRQVVIFAHHKHVVAAIKEGLADYRVGVISGEVSQDERGQIVEAFQAGNLDVVVASMKAASVGITLNRASDVIMVERAWTPADEEQAEDRVHRIGQQDGVVVRYLKAVDTIDEYMADLLEKKREVVHQVLDGSRGVESVDIRHELVELVRADFEKITKRNRR